jgi:hypothetical protein
MQKMPLFAGVAREQQGKFQKKLRFRQTFARQNSSIDTTTNVQEAILC